MASAAGSPPLTFHTSAKTLGGAPANRKAASLPCSVVHQATNVLGQKPQIEVGTSNNLASSALQVGVLASCVCTARKRVMRKQAPKCCESSTKVAQQRMSTKDRASMHLLDNYGTRNLVFASGSGSYLYDETGKEYLDFTAGIAVNCLGHADAGWAEVVSQQAKTLIHTGNGFLTSQQVDLAEKLKEVSFAEKVFLCNSGTEANEAAIKFSRKFHYDLGKPREKFVAFENAFHGRTMGALALTYKEKYKAPFQPTMSGAEFLSFDSTQGLEAIDEATCAVFVEPVQGEGGVTPASSEFLQALRSRCDAVGALLVFDEVQCGLGRTGNLFAYQLKGVVPDIMTLAKPLAAGLPIGAVLTTDKVASCIKPGDHGSTFAGAPLVCAAANYTLDVISQPEFLANVCATGAALREGLCSLFADRDDVVVRGEGLLLGVVFPTVEECLALKQAAEDNGLLVLTAGKGHVLRITPPLTASLEEVSQCLALLKKALHQD